ncbi:hypothetical protein KIPB_003432 [Kipferlia bialata]|uniref:Nudix hydrolase domain-containing protein n=1 Tax=Kipferlia bialata TaxID=797122 RepID=A0A9K3GGN1_9EUKA|nr:hypothetical protein KIPB_003432 [Kipferlia bialata]|eukprot:g3432.t1
MVPMSPSVDRVTSVLKSASFDVLLSIEHRQKGKQRDEFSLHILGGKKEPGETVRQTAVREFWEETSELLRLSECDAMLAPEAQPIYIESGKYSLFVTPASDRVQALPDRFTPNREVHRLVWISLDSLLHGVRERVPLTLPRGVVVAGETEGEGEGEETVLKTSRFLATVMWHKGTEPTVRQVAQGIDETPDTTE